mgnify:CR=1 FL=1
MKAAICIDAVLPGLEPAEQIARVAAAGFDAVEFWSWRGRDLDALGAACERHGVRVVSFTGHRVGDPVAAQTHADFLASVAETVPVARRLDCRTLLLLTNVLGSNGRPVDTHDYISDEAKYANVVAALKRVLEETPEDIHFNLEPLNTRLDHPGYYLSDMRTATRLIRDVGDPRLKVLCDLYHQRVMGDDLVALVAEHLPHIGHFHLADVPGRHEPGTGEVDWVPVLRRVKKGGYRGYVGFEYFPAQPGSADGLAAVQRLWASL